MPVMNEGRREIMLRGDSPLVVTDAAASVNRLTKPTATAEERMATVMSEARLLASGSEN